MKQELRRRIRAARAGRAPSPDFVARVLDRVPAGSTVCCYVALPGEPPTSGIIEALLARGDAVFLPVASGENPTTLSPDPHHDLAWVPAATSRPWAAWGVGGRTCPVPPHTLPAPDVVIVPALAVDAQGRRLGQGGGYYDRFVPQHPHARTIALLWSGEVLPDIGAEPHDIAVTEWVLADG